MVFNSLGSNYNIRYALNALFSIGSKTDSQKLVKYLEKKYSGRVILVYKGREALKLALQASRLPLGSKVGITGFTCFVAYQAIKEAGYDPEFIDISRDTLNFSLEGVRRHKDNKALILQNTLGIPCDIEKIKSYCLERNIILIEDLAHSVGMRYRNGKEAGTIGDFTALSFSQDKSIDSVSGGALVIRNKKYENFSSKENFKNIGTTQRLKDRLYPILTFKVRLLYPLGLGKALHYLLKKLKLLSVPVGEGKIVIHKLPDWYSKVALSQFQSLEYDVARRRQIAKIYLNRINKSILLSGVSQNIEYSSNLRFPVFVKNRASLINNLKEKGIYVSDIWYDSPVAPKKFIGKTDYKGDCKTAETVSKEILNLPTHKNVSVNEAVRISKNINRWLNTQ